MRAKYGISEDRIQSGTNIIFATDKDTIAAPFRKIFKVITRMSHCDHDETMPAQVSGEIK